MLRLLVMCNTEQHYRRTLDMCGIPRAAAIRLSYVDQVRGLSGDLAIVVKGVGWETVEPDVLEQVRLRGIQVFTITDMMRWNEGPEDALATGEERFNISEAHQPAYCFGPGPWDRVRKCMKCGGHYPCDAARMVKAYAALSVVWNDERNCRIIAESKS